VSANRVIDDSQSFTGTVADLNHGAFLDFADLVVTRRRRLPIPAPN